MEQLPRGTSAPGNYEIIYEGEGVDSLSGAFDKVFGVRIYSSSWRSVVDRSLM